MSGGEESVVQISDLVAAALNSDTLHTNPDGSIQVVIASDNGDVQLDGNSDEVVVINLGNNEQDDQLLHKCQVCHNEDLLIFFSTNLINFVI